MTTTSNAITTSSFTPAPVKDGIVPLDPFDGGCPADTQQWSPATHFKNVIELTTGMQDQVAKLTAENAKLRAAIRQANASIERMLGEVDLMVAKMKGVGK